MTRRNKHHLPWLAALLVAGAASQLPSALAQAPKKDKPAKDTAAMPEKKAAKDSQPIQQGETEINADKVDYDLTKRQYYFVGHVDLTNPSSHMTCDKMTVQMNPDNEIDWAKCDGRVFIRKKDPKDGSVMTGNGDFLDYNETTKKAVLTGTDVVIHQDSASLAKPAVITGSRVDMDLDKKINIIHRKPNEQAKAHVEPKGADDKPKPEPTDLIADEIHVNDETQEYEAVGKPLMLRPSTKLKGRKITFKVEGDSKDIKVAHVYDDVIYDGTNDKGSVCHATGDYGLWTKDSHEMVLEGRNGGLVHATTQDPDAERPNVYQGDRFTYNSETGAGKMEGGASKIQPKLILPGGTGQKKKDDSDKPGADTKKPPAKKPDSKAEGKQ